jgi:hypothetical protein
MGGSRELSLRTPPIVALRVGMIGRSLSSTLEKSPKRAFTSMLLTQTLPPCLAQTARPGSSHCFGLRTRLRPRKYLSNHTLLSFLRGFSLLRGPLLPNHALRPWPRHLLMPPPALLLAQQYLKPLRFAQLPHMATQASRGQSLPGSCPGLCAR